MVVTSKIYRLYIQTFLPNAKISIEQNPFGWKRDWNDKKNLGKRERNTSENLQLKLRAYTIDQKRTQHLLRVRTQHGVKFLRSEAIRAHSWGPHVQQPLDPKIREIKIYPWTFFPLQNQICNASYLMFCCSQEFFWRKLRFFSKTFSPKKKFDSKDVQKRPCLNLPTVLFFSSKRSEIQLLNSSFQLCQN